MIVSYDKNELLKDLKEYLKHNIIAPTDYIQVLRHNINYNDSTLVACWLIDDYNLAQIRNNEDRNLEHYIDREGNYICPHCLDLITVQQYFDEIKEKMFD